MDIPKLPMANDLFSTYSPDKLAQEVNKHVLADKRSLPDRAKIFAAVAKMQGFDAFPEWKPFDQIDRLVKEGAHEMQRGLSGANGLPALMFARELLIGALYPGTQCAFGTGVYFTDLGCAFAPEKQFQGFAKIARTAYDHAGADTTGVILRCVLKPGSRILTHDELKDLRRENRNRFREAQLQDCGSLAAAIGCDGYTCPGIGPNEGEQWHVIVNRTALIFQNTCANHSQLAPPP